MEESIADVRRSVLAFVQSVVCCCKVLLGGDTGETSWDRVYVLEEDKWLPMLELIAEVEGSAIVVFTRSVAVRRGMWLGDGVEDRD